MFQRFACSRVLILLAGLLLATACTAKSGAVDPYTDGAEYVTLPAPHQRYSSEGKVEVVEVFSYGCIHCAHFAPVADALARDHLRGAALDVYVGEFERPPIAPLWSDPRVLITPHISGASDQDRHGGTDLFCDNLRAWIDGRPMRNVIDWKRGY